MRFPGKGASLARRPSGKKKGKELGKNVLGFRDSWRAGVDPGSKQDPQTFSVGGPRKGPAYLGFVEQKPHEGGEQQGRGQRGARPQLLGEGGKGGGGGFLGQGHGVGGTHVAERAAGYAPTPTRLTKGLRGSPRAVPQPGHRSQRRSHRTPSVTRGAVTATAGPSARSSASTSPPRAANRPGPALALRRTG